MFWQKRLLFYKQIFVLGILESINSGSCKYWINLENNQLNIGYPIDNYGYAYVYSQNSTIYPYIQQYKLYLEELGAVISDARLL